MPHNPLRQIGQPLLLNGPNGKKVITFNGTSDHITSTGLNISHFSFIDVPRCQNE